MQPNLNKYSGACAFRMLRGANKSAIIKYVFQTFHSCILSVCFGAQPGNILFQGYTNILNVFHPALECVF